MWQIFENSKIRDIARDNRESRECGRYPIIRDNNRDNCELRECVLFLCPYVLKFAFDSRNSRFITFSAAFSEWGEELSS